MSRRLVDLAVLAEEHGFDPPGNPRPGDGDRYAAARRRFTWGVGSGEALNEHVLGDRWPPADLRLEMLKEAVEVVRELCAGEQVTQRGKHYTVENAQLYDPPLPVPLIIVSAFGPTAAELAGRIGDEL